MFLVLCDIADGGALWFAGQVRRAGHPCVVATPDLLSFARRRSQRLGAAGVASVVELADGTVVDRPRFVLNRLMEPPATAWRRAAAAERDYATAELGAFVLSWLSALDCPVRNRPVPSCLAGPAPHPLVSSAAAARAGLATPDLRLDPAAGPSADGQLAAALRASGPGARPVHAVCLDGAVVNAAVPPAVAEGVGRFAAMIGAEAALIGIDFLVRDGTWWFAGMTPLADLRAGGATMVEGLVGLAVEVVP